MPGPSQIIEIPLGGGVDEITQPELVAPGSFLTASNAIHAHLASVEKAPGFSSIAGGLSTARRLIGFRDELLEIDGQQLYTWGRTAGASFAKSRVPEPRVRRVAIGDIVSSSTITGGTYADIASNGTYIVVVALQGSIGGTTASINAWVIDAATNALVYGPTLLASGAGLGAVKVVCCGNIAIAAWDQGSGANINADTLNLAGLNSGATWSGPTTLTTSAQVASTSWDLASLSSTLFAVAYPNSSATTSSLTVATYFGTSSPTLTASTNLNVGSTTTTGAACGGVAGDTLWVLYATGAGNTVSAVALNPNGLAVTGTAASFPTVPGQQAKTFGVVQTTSQHAVGAWSYQNGNTTANPAAQFSFANLSISAGAVVIGTQTVVPRLHMFARPWVSANGRVYAGVMPITMNDVGAANGGQPRGYAVVVDITSPGYPLRPVVNIVPRLVGASPGGTRTPAHVARVTANDGANKDAVLFFAAQTTFSQSLEFYTVDTDTVTQRAWQGAEYDKLLGIAGGVASFYDGLQVGEMSFLWPPEVNHIVTAAGSLTATGGVIYVAVYEAFDGRGWVAWSQPSTPITTGALTNNNVTVNVSTLPVSARSYTYSINGIAPVRIVLYRTKTAAGSTVYFRVTGSETIMPAPGNSVADFVSITDNVADANLGAPLYTQPGITGTAFPRQAPPALSCLVRHQDRLFGIAEETNVIWYSGQLVVGEQPWFHDNFTIPVPSKYPLTALASMDGRLVAFSREEIAFVDGSGPPDNGVGGDFSAPAFIANTIGALDWRSVVVTPIGVFFQSARGLELLGRSMSVEDWAGKPVAVETAAYPTCTSAVYDEVTRRVYFTLISGPESAPTGGVIVVFDLAMKTWTTLPYSGCVSACLVGGASDSASPVYTVVQQGQVPMQLTPGGWLTPASAFQPTTVELPWIKLAGPQGHQLVRRVNVRFKSPDPHNITVSLAFDYGSYVQTATWTAAQIQAFGDVNVVQMFPQNTNARCRAIKVKIQDATATGGPATVTGQGMILYSVALEVAPMAGIGRVPAAQRA